MIKETTFLKSGKSKLKPIKKKRGIWFWIGMQGLVLAGVVVIYTICHIRISRILPFQCTASLAILYWQMRSLPIAGLEILVGPAEFSKWDIIAIGNLRTLCLIYKMAVRAEGTTIFVFPYFPSRWKLKNLMQVYAIRVGVI